MKLIRAKSALGNEAVDCDADRMFLAWVKIAVDADLIAAVNDWELDEWKHVAVERECVRRGIVT